MTAQHGLTAAQLMRLWEDGRASDRRFVDDVPLGVRNTTLLELRQATFGDRIECFFTCGTCGERLEFEITVSGILSALPDAGPFVFEEDEWRIRFRELTTSDLAAAAMAGNVDAARARLLERSIEAAQCGGENVAADEIPDEVIERFAAALAAADPAADLAFALTCPQCEAHEEALLDVGEFLWREISAQARRLLSDVDVLARTYCWPESEILAMSSARRQAYLELAGR